MITLVIGYLQIVTPFWIIYLTVRLRYRLVYHGRPMSHDSRPRPTCS